MRLSMGLAAALIAGLPLAWVDSPAGLTAAAPAAAPAALAPGDAAPPFAMMGSDGRTYRLADYRGKQAVVLAWFAKPFSGG
jgi:peroxiredoxin Q/BCP